MQAWNGQKRGSSLRGAKHEGPPACSRLAACRPPADLQVLWRRRLLLPQSPPLGQPLTQVCSQPTACAVYLAWTRAECR